MKDCLDLAAPSNAFRVDDLATTFTVYPSLSGSIAEAARRLQAPVAPGNSPV